MRYVFALILYGGWLCIELNFVFVGTMFWQEHDVGWSSLKGR